MSNTLKITFVLSMLFLSACAHHRDVRAGANGVHRVVVKDEDGHSGAQGAISQANDFCEKKRGGRSAAFLKEKKQYDGDMDEKSYKNAKRASKVAQTVGGGVWAHGGKRESTFGGLVGLGGSAVDQALGEAYTIDMKFKCI
ncbi:MAG: hypothetical protein ABS42_00020 [Bdellovibrio sp. SCN 50-8]|nr:MAG: hypothetical protein ABS42_00020 [Bdellovibrio sp. SCN 50-8]